MKWAHPAAAARGGRQQRRHPGELGGGGRAEDGRELRDHERRVDQQGRQHDQG